MLLSMSSRDSLKESHKQQEILLKHYRCMQRCSNKSMCQFHTYACFGTNCIHSISYEYRATTKMPHYTCSCECPRGFKIGSAYTTINLVYEWFCFMKQTLIRISLLYTLTLPIVNISKVNQNNRKIIQYNNRDFLIVYDSE